MFKKFLRSFGIGATKVDARLKNDSFLPGDLIEGEIHIVGGSAAQEIASLNLKIMTSYKYQKSGDGEHQHTVTANYPLKTQWILERFMLEANEEKVVPFSIELPLNTPVTTLGRGHRVWLATTLDTEEDSDNADPKDSDKIEVRPLPIVEKVLRAVESVGFQLYKVDVEGWEESGGFSSRGDKFPFFQEFEFRPVGEFQGKMRELEVYFNQRSRTEVEVKVEFEKRLS